MEKANDVLFSERDYVNGKALPKLLARWWLKMRICKNAIQLGPKGMPACVEFYVPWWGWPFEMIHRLIFGKAVLK